MSKSYAEGMDVIDIDELVEDTTSQHNNEENPPSEDEVHTDD